MNILRKLNDWADRWPLAAYVCVIAGIALALIRIEGARHESQGQNEETLGSIIAVQIQNCRSDHRFREQYKKRGEAEKALIGLFLSLARTNVAAGNDPTGQSQAFLDKFGPLDKELRIIPIPNCRVVGTELREVIENTGVEIPPIPELEKLINPRKHRESRQHKSNPTTQNSNGGDANQTPSTAHQQPGPRNGGHADAPKAPKKRQPPPPAPAPVSPPPPAPPAPTPPPEPGNSGNGASAEHGLDVCVELAASACVKTDVGVSLP